MPSRERIDSLENVRQWRGDMPLRYVYTAGVAGEFFLEWLKKGKIQTSRCERCGVAYLPPRMYCPECFNEVHSFVPVGDSGKVAAHTTLGKDGRHYVFVTYRSVKGGIVHRAISGRPRIGASAVAVFKPEKERTGTILDLLGFRIGKSLPRLTQKRKRRR